MVAVQVLDELYHLTIKSNDDGLDLLGRRDEFYHLLQGPGTMAVQSDLDHLWSGVVDQDCTLLIVGELKKFLAEIVAKRICVGQQEHSLYWNGN